MAGDTCLVLRSEFKVLSRIWLLDVRWLLGSGPRVFRACLKHEVKAENSVSSGFLPRNLRLSSWMGWEATAHDGQTALCGKAPLICGSSRWVVEGCACGWSHPVGREVSYQTESFGDSGAVGHEAVTWPAGRAESSGTAPLWPAPPSAETPSHQPPLELCQPLPPWEGPD